MKKLKLILFALHLYTDFTLKMFWIFLRNLPAAIREGYEYGRNRNL
jgi:hypothetical protein